MRATSPLKLTQHSVLNDVSRRYLVNVAVTNTATGEVATYEVSPAPSLICRSTPLPPSHATQPPPAIFLKHPSGPHHSKRNSGIQSARGFRSRLRRHHRCLRDGVCTGCHLCERYSVLRAKEDEAQAVAQEAVKRVSSSSSSSSTSHCDLPHSLYERPPLTLNPSPIWSFDNT